MDSIAEFNVEAGRPDSITREKLEVMKKYKVSRISINPQTMNEKTLKLIGRHHSVESVRESFALAREMGFSNINMDLILGLPGETKEDVLYTFSEVEKMAPDSVTVHSLAVKTHSRLREQWEEYKGYVMENSSYLMQAANETAERLGLKPYYLYRQKQMVGNLENVGFAKPGLEGLYNILIMEEQQDIVALGAGTASKKVHMDGTTSRCENVKDVDTYIDRIDEMIERKRKLFS
jgi:oxygen-independent coproporphyrinogen-3 oxidase